MRPPIMITNTDRLGRIMNNKWYIRIGKRWKIVGEKDAPAGLEWLQKQLGDKDA